MLCNRCGKQRKFLVTDPKEGKICSLCCGELDKIDEVTLLEQRQAEANGYGDLYSNNT